MKNSLTVAAVLAILVASGCTTVTTVVSELQSPITTFDQATHSASTAETALISAAQSINIEKQFYTDANNFASANVVKGALIGADGRPVNFDLRALYKATVLTPDQVKTRQALMDAIVLYADKMQALASDGDDKTLDANSTSVAIGIKNVAGSSKISLSSATQEDVAIAETALVTIADWALDKKKYNDITEAGNAMKIPLSQLVDILKRENTTLSNAINNDIGLIEEKMRLQVISLRTSDDSKVRGPETFFAIIQARQLLAGALSKEPQPSSDGSLFVDFAKPVNDTLDSIISGNAAIAAGKKVGGLSGIANLISAQASAASSFYQGLTKSS